MMYFTSVPPHGTQCLVTGAGSGVGAAVGAAVGAGVGSGVGAGVVVVVHLDRRLSLGFSLRLGAGKVIVTLMSVAKENR